MLATSADVASPSPERTSSLGMLPYIQRGSDPNKAWMIRAVIVRSIQTTASESKTSHRCYASS